MDTKYQTSFIPKKPVSMVGQGRSIGINLFLLVSIIIFLISLGLAGYVYLEKQHLRQAIATDQNSIETNKSGLTSDSATIENLVELNSRINVANILLGEHVAISPVFNFLQQGTLKSVRFSNFGFTSTGKDASGAAVVSVQMSGVAKDWETVASQADEFGKSDWKKIISQPKISNLTLNADGSISFLFSAYVVPSFLIYGNNVNN